MSIAADFMFCVPSGEYSYCRVVESISLLKGTINSLWMTSQAKNKGLNRLGRGESSPRPLVTVYTEQLVSDRFWFGPAASLLEQV